tara:strand:- start:21147 stop:22829 length:1683 start_codon:yes stop_codon:yes gene_type:complete
MNWFDSGKQNNKNWLGGRGNRSRANMRNDNYSLFDPSAGGYGSSVWDDLGDGGGGWFYQPPKDELVDMLRGAPDSGRAVDRFSYDAQEFQRIAKNNYTMRGVAKRGQSTHKDFPILVEDVFNAFHKGHPVLRHDSELDDFSKFSKQIVQAILDDPKYDALRQTTKWDRLYSAWATRTLDELFRKCGGELAGKAGERNGEAVEDGEGESGSGDSDGEGGEHFNGDDFTDEQKEQIKNAVAEFMGQAMEEVAEAEKTTSKWGLGQGSFANVTDGEVDELLNLLKTAPNVDQLTEMIGRVSGIMNDVESEAKSITHGAPVGYILGDELTRMAPQEYVNLAHPDLKMDLQRRMHEHSIQVLERESPDSLGHGPMIVLLDGSQSMMNRHMNSTKSRMTWAVSMAIMLFRRAMSTGQPFILHKFSYSTYSFKYEQPAKQYADFLKEVMVHENGGTYIDEAMEATIESLKEYPEGDVVILSDCELSQNWYDPDYDDANRFKAATDEAKCKVVGVLINESQASAWHNEGDDTTSTPYQNLCHVAFQINPAHDGMLTQVTEGVFREVIL